MKKIVVFSLVCAVILLASCASAQKVSPEDATYSETVNVPGMQKDALFDRINLWASDSFKGPDPAYVTEKSKIVSVNKDQGIINARHTVLTDWGKNAMAIGYNNVVINVSDGQYRIVFNMADFQSYTMVSGGIYSNKYPYDGRLIGVTRGQWQDFADALRDTVSGTLVRN